MQTLITELYDAFSRLELLQFDEDYIGELGAPCSPEQIATAVQDLGQPLPPSYGAFLALHNGWTDFIGEAPLLAVEDRGSAQYQRRVKGIGEHLRSFEMHDFVPHSFFILAHPDVSTVLYFDKLKPTGGGELEMVEHSLREGELGRYPSFEAYLREVLSVTERLIVAEEG